MSWHRPTKKSVTILEPEWFPPSLEGKVKSFKAGSYGVRFDSASRNINGLEVACDAEIIFFNLNGKLSITAAVSSRNVIYFESFRNPSGYLVFNINNVKCATSSVKGGLANVEGSALNRKLISTTGEVSLPAFRLHVVGGDLYEKQTEPKYSTVAILGTPK